MTVRLSEQGGPIHSRILSVSRHQHPVATRGQQHTLETCASGGDFSHFYRLPPPRMHERAEVDIQMTRGTYFQRGLISGVLIASHGPAMFVGVDATEAPLVGNKWTSWLRFCLIRGISGVLAY